MQNIIQYEIQNITSHDIQRVYNKGHTLLKTINITNKSGIYDMVVPFLNKKKNILAISGVLHLCSTYKMS